MPANTPAPLVLRSFVFQHLEGGQFKIVHAYLSEGVQQTKNSIPMLGGVHFFVCFSCSVALPLLTFSTPPRPECLFCYWGDGLAFSCSVALTFFCASHARWRCGFQLFQPLHCHNACFATGVTDWRSHAHGANACFDRGATDLHYRARWRSFFCASYVEWRNDFQCLQPLYCANACFA